MKKSEPVERVPESRSARSGTGGTQSRKKIGFRNRRNAGTRIKIIGRSGGTQKKNLGGTQKS